MREEAGPDVRKLFGARLAELRRRLGWSQERLALESGVARSYLGDVERGQRNPALVNICRLAETMGLKPFHLLDFDSDLPLPINLSNS
jgi:transcriptional regulator with XRE-family HTH domain